MNSSAGAPPCPAPVRSMEVTDDAVVATLQPGRRSCFAGAMTAGAVLAPPAAASCDAIEHVEVGAGLITIVADAVDSRSVSQACTRPVA